MKLGKIHVGKIIDTREANCDLCKEESMQCIVLERKIYKWDHDIEYKNTGFLGLGDVERVVVRDNAVKRKVTFYLCSDCIGDIYKAIK